MNNSKKSTVYKWIERLFAAISCVVPVLVVIGMWKKYIANPPSSGEGQFFGLICIVISSLIVLSYIYDGIMFYYDSFTAKRSEYFFSMKMILGVVYLILAIFVIISLLSMPSSFICLLFVLAVRWFEYRRCMYYCSKCGKRLRKGALLKRELKRTSTEFGENGVFKNYDQIDENLYYCKRCGYSIKISVTKSKSDYKRY